MRLSDDIRDLKIIGPMHNCTGYAAATRGLVAAALHAGFRVEAVETEMSETITLTSRGIESVKAPAFLRHSISEEVAGAMRSKVAWNAPAIIVQPAREFGRFVLKCQGYRIGYTTWESERVPETWDIHAANVDQILLPSRYNQDGFPFSSTLLPYCVDERIWNDPAVQPMPIPHRPDFLFGAVFNVNERKNWRQLIQCFMEEFRGENVGLILKVSSDIEEIQKVVRDARRFGAWIQVIGGDWDDAKLLSFYKALDCYALPSCEGFGMPAAEAGMAGIPALVLDHSGVTDIVTGETGYLVKSQLEPCYGHYPDIYRSTNSWSKPDLDDLKRTLRQALNDPDRLAKGAKAKERCLALFSREAIAERLLEILSEEHAKPADFGTSTALLFSNADHEIARSLRVKAAPGEKSGEPLRIAVVSTWDIPCGVGIYTEKLVHELRERGHRVQVLAAMEEASDVRYEAQSKGVVRCWERGGPMDGIVTEAAKFHAEVVLFSHEYSFTTGNTSQWDIVDRCVRNLQSGGAKVVFAYHTVKAEGHPIQDLSSIDGSVAMNPMGAVTILKGSRGRKTAWIPHGCPPLLDSAPAGKPTGAVATFGFTQPSKGYEDLLLSIAYGNRSTPMHLDLYGKVNPAGGDSQEDVDALMAEIARTLHVGVFRHQDFLPEDELLKSLSTADVLIFGAARNTSILSSSASVPTAMATGRPIVAFDLPHYMGDEEFDKAVLKAKSPEHAGELLSELMSDRKLHAQQTRLVREYAANRTFAVMAAEYEAFLERIVHAEATK